MALVNQEIIITFKNISTPNRYHNIILKSGFDKYLSTGRIHI